MSHLKAWTDFLPRVLRPSPALGFDIVRAYLGIGLFLRGVLFVTQPEHVLDFLKSGESWFLPYAITHYVALAHLGGGILLTLGLATRLAAISQLPVLFGAVFFVHSTDGLLSAGQSLEFSALVLMLLGVYTVLGSGQLSLDAWLGERLSLLGSKEETETNPASILQQGSASAARTIGLN
jgi:putative oxidoreductase